MRKSLTVLFLFCLFSSAHAHKFYTSITDISYNEKSKSLEIMAKLFIDDFEKAIEENYGKKLFLNTDKEVQDDKGLIEKYISSHFQIEIKSKLYPINYLGKETDRDYIWIYIEIEKVKSLSKITIRNTILTDVFPDQTNLINIDTDMGVKSVTLHKDLPSYSF